MKKYIYIILAALGALSCEVDNIGPLLDEDIDRIFFDVDSIGKFENDPEPIEIRVSSIKPGKSTTITLGGTAVRDVDYVLTGDLNVSFGESGDAAYNQYLSITLIDNTVGDDDKTITLSLPSGQGLSETNRRELIIAIINNDVSSGTVEVPISASHDDVEEIAVLEAGSSDAVGDMDLTSSDLEFGEMSGSQGLMTIGLRFNNIQIPANVNILSAAIQFTADNTGSEEAELTIYGENVADAAEYTNTPFNVSSREKTTNSAVWNIAPWPTRGESGAAQKTVDLSSIVQEIVDNEAWDAGNSINFIMEHSGASIGVTDTSNGREAETFDGTAAPVLIIDWELK